MGFDTLGMLVLIMVVSFGFTGSNYFHPTASKAGDLMGEKAVR